MVLTLREPQGGTELSRIRSVIDDYDQVSGWSDQPGRQCELARLGGVAIELLRQLSDVPAGETR